MRALPLEASTVDGAPESARLQRHRPRADGDRPASAREDAGQVMIAGAVPAQMPAPSPAGVAPDQESLAEVGGTRGGFAGVAAERPVAAGALPAAANPRPVHPRAVLVELERDGVPRRLEVEAERLSRAADHERERDSLTRGRSHDVGELDAAAGVEIEVAVVVVVRERHPLHAAGMPEAARVGHVDEAGAAVVPEQAQAVRGAGEQQIREPVEVDVGPGDAARRVGREAPRLRDVRECPVAAVPEEPARRRVVGDHQIEPAVAIGVEPRDRARATARIGDAGRRADLGEAPVAVVPVETVLLRPRPRSAPRVT